MVEAFESVSLLRTRGCAFAAVRTVPFSDYDYAREHEHGMESVGNAYTSENRSSEAGMTLFETMACVAVLAVVVNIAAGALLMCLRLSAKGTTALDRTWAVEEVRAEFTEAVREGARIVPAVCAYRTGDEQVVLEMPPDEDEPNVKRYTVLGFLGKESRMSKMRIVERYGPQMGGAVDMSQFPQELMAELMSVEGRGPGGPSSVELEGFETFRLPIETLRFVYGAGDPAESRLVTVAIDVKDDRPRGGEAVIHRFSASPRGVAWPDVGGAS